MDYEEQLPVLAFDEYPDDESPRASAGPLVEEPQSDEEREALRRIQQALISSKERRAVACFLDTAGYETVEETTGALMAMALHECYPRFVKSRGGRIVHATAFSQREEVNPDFGTVRVDGEERRFLTFGLLFAVLPEEKVVVSVMPIMGGTITRVRSNKDSAALLREWTQFCAKNCYMKNRVFTPEGRLLERSESFNWDDIVLDKRVRRTVGLHVGSFLKNCDVLEQVGMRPRRGLLLAGKPGCGKTLLGKVLANRLKEVSFIWVTPGCVRSASEITDIVQLSRMVAPTVLFMEDIDLYAEDRSGIKDELRLGQLMNELDGALENRGLVVIAATNRPEVVEKALRNRPGRFDRTLCLNPPDEEGREQLIRHLLSQGAEISEEDFLHLVEKSKGDTGAEIRDLVETILLLAVNEGQRGNGQGVRVSRDLIDAALLDRGEKSDEGGRVGFATAA